MDFLSLVLTTAQATFCLVFLSTEVPVSTDSTFSYLTRVCKYFSHLSLFVVFGMFIIISWNGVSGASGCSFSHFMAGVLAFLSVA